MSPAPLICQHRRFPSLALQPPEKGRQLVDGEELVAEQDVVLRNDYLLNVRISEHPREEFWRVKVTVPAEQGTAASATVGAGESFLMHLIDRALGGEQTAWRHLAAWGHNNLCRSVPGVRVGPARVTG